MKKHAVVLLGFGGAESLDEVPSFLKALFSDPFVFCYPTIIRKSLAWFLTKRSTQRVRENYKILGGKSPFVENTTKQAKALQKELKNDATVFTAMRYSPPLVEDVFLKVKAFQPDFITLLPLYPQFSMTTTLSAFKTWQLCAKKEKVSILTRYICCYPEDAGFIGAYTESILEKCKNFKDLSTFRFLFSAHGIPMSFVKAGDPYTSHIKKSAHTLLKSMEEKRGQKFDGEVCYQSRVGPLPWTEPYLDDALKKAAKDLKDVIIVPLSFISEHSETLVELDREYAEKAKEVGIKRYIRIPTVSCHDAFIKSLAKRVREQGTFQRVCSKDITQCWCELSHA